MQQLDDDRRQFVNWILSATEKQFNIILNHLTPEEAELIADWIQLSQDEVNNTIMETYGMDEAKQVIERIKKL